MHFPEINFPISSALELDAFKAMDYYAVDHYALPIELMMENAGLSLAKVIVASVSKSEPIQIGVGKGNNGGGGLVAARRLAAWGFDVYLDVAMEMDEALPQKQLQRALLFGAKAEEVSNPAIWVDAYLGFSQRLPLRESIAVRISAANESSALRISLDIPTGFLGDPSVPFFNAHQVVTLAAPKRILFNLEPSVELFVADLGIPSQVYNEFNISALPFEKGAVLKLKR